LLLTPTFIQESQRSLMEMAKINALLLPALFALTATVSAGQTKRPSPPKPFRVTGTYSNMNYNAEGGDVIGDEVRIVYTRNGYQGVVQFAEGAPKELVIVSVEVVGTRISFSVPDSSPYAGKFTGMVENGVLKGEFHFKSGGADKVELKKGKSYWD
jgi:hypothetical protein